LVRTPTRFDNRVTRRILAAMTIDPEVTCRCALGLMLVGLAVVGIPPRLRAERAGGKVSRQGDPRWFWVGMALVGPPVPLVCAAFMVDPRWVDFARAGLPFEVRLLGIPVGGLGLGLFAWMFRHLGLNVTSTSLPRADATLVTSGPYRWVRHPMYLAALILLGATTLLTANWVVAICGGAACGLLIARSRIEERRLVEKFGDAYRNYQRRTGRVFPRIFR
jgi:protein-S-isoprenylcysteine O-methyltransferase Ste14